MERIAITVREKVARTQGSAVYVCGNADYNAVFDFDGEWDAYPAKTARFVTAEGACFDVPFTGCECKIPRIDGTCSIYAGVFAGEMHTTTPAHIVARKSIRDMGGEVMEPSPDVYAKIMEMINDGMLRGEPGLQGEPGPKGDPGEPGYTPVKGVDYFDGAPGEPGAPGRDGTDATVTTESIKDALGYKPADDADMAGKLTEPATGLAVGKYFRVSAIDEAGHAVLEAVDLPSAPVQDVKINGETVVKDGVASVPLGYNNDVFGVVTATSNFGLAFSSPGYLRTSPLTESNIDYRSQQYRVVTGTNFDYAVKAGMCDGKGAAWTDAERIAALLRMGCTVDDSGYVRWAPQEA